MCQNIDSKCKYTSSYILLTVAISAALLMTVFVCTLLSALLCILLIGLKTTPECVVLWFSPHCKPLPFKGGSLIFYHSV